MTKTGLVKYTNPCQVNNTKRLAKDKKKLTETEDILNSILPPKEWTKDGQLWVQNVSSTPATRLDVVNLQEELDRALQEQQARETGICPIREELYAQCFDELIRQVTVNCAERGLLLVRTRDEIRMAISAYQTLYESSIAFGMRKTLMAEQRKAELEARIANLRNEKQEYEEKVSDLSGKCEDMESSAQSKRQDDEKKHAEEVDFLWETNDQLKKNLEALLSAPKR